MQGQSFEQQPYRSSPPEYTQYPSAEYRPPETYYVPPPYEPPQTPYAPPQYMPPPQFASPPPVYYVQQEEPGSMPALLGFIFSLVGVPAPILLVPALVLSIIGLRSRSRHGLALAGMIISIILLSLWVVYIVAIVAFAIFAIQAPAQ